MKFFSVTDEFTKNPQLKEEDLNHLKEWIAKQPHLPHVTGEYSYSVILFIIPMIKKET